MQKTECGKRGVLRKRVLLLNNKRTTKIIINIIIIVYFNKLKFVNLFSTIFN